MGFQPKTFMDLCFAMKTGADVNIDGTRGVILGIEKEDGSGHNWNVTIFPEASDKISVKISVFFRES